MSSFDDLKTEYFSARTSEERKTEIVRLMQQSLQERCGNDGEPITCLDGKEHSMSSNNVQDLLAIDGLLRYNTISNKMTEIGERMREKH